MAKKKQITVEQFNALSKAEQKVMVCEDVIAQVKLEKYIAEQGAYIGLIAMKSDGNSMTSSQYRKKIGKLDIQSNLDNIEKCNVCAIGACILSITKYKNKLRFSNISGSAEQMSAKTRKLVDGVFTPKELAIMENIFEGYGTINYVEVAGKDSDISAEEQNMCDSIYYNYDNDNDRLVGIMQNIIDNKGELLLNKFN